MPVTAMWRWDFALASFSLQAFRHMGCGVAIYLLSPRSPIRKIGRAMFAGIAPFFLTTNRSASEEAIQGWMQTLTFTGRWEYFRASSNQLPKGTFNMKSIKRDSSRVQTSNPLRSRSGGLRNNGGKRPDGPKQWNGH
jgi:hypothetical protein